MLPLYRADTLPAPRACMQVLDRSWWAWRARLWRAWPTCAGSWTGRVQAGRARPPSVHEEGVLGVGCRGGVLFFGAVRGWGGLGELSTRQPP